MRSVELLRLISRRLHIHVAIIAVARTALVWLVSYSAIRFTGG